MKLDNARYLLRIFTLLPFRSNIRLISCCGKMRGMGGGGIEKNAHNNECAKGNPAEDSI